MATQKGTDFKETRCLLFNSLFVGDTDTSETQTGRDSSLCPEEGRSHVSCLSGHEKAQEEARPVIHITPL